MDTLAAEQLILSEGRSEALTQAFALIAEASAPDGGPRYPARATRELARIVVCRTYAGPLLELSHLIIAAREVHPKGSYEAFFWELPRAAAPAFKGAFAGGRSPGGRAQAAPSGVTVGLEDKSFTVTYGRMPLLAALLEFLFTALGYRAADDLLAPLSEARKSSDVGGVANALYRALYAYLKGHLPAVQVQRRNRAMIQFLSEAGDGQLDAGRIDDGAVMAYWRHASLEAGDVVEGRTFAGVFEAMDRLARTLEVALDRAEMAGARPIGTDRDAGEVDPAEVEALLDAVDEADDILAPFADPPLSRIKFLNGREQATAREVMMSPGVSRRFPLSVLRNAVFGQHQAKITNALRQRAGTAGTRKLIDEGPDDTYEDRLSAYHKLDQHIARVLGAVFAALLEARRPEAAVLSLDMVPGLNLAAELGAALPRDILGELREEGHERDGNVVAFPGAGRGMADETFSAGGAASAALAGFFSAVERAEERSESPLGRHAVQAARALKGLARQGFRPEDRVESEVIEGFAAAPPALRAVQRELRAYLEGPGTGAGLTTRFAADAAVFREQFEKIYGETNGG